MTECEKMKMFIDDHTDVAMKYMIWEDAILNNNNKQENGATNISDIDFDIID